MADAKEVTGHAGYFSRELFAGDCSNGAHYLHAQSPAAVGKTGRVPTRVKNMLQVRFLPPLRLF